MCVCVYAAIEPMFHAPCVYCNPVDASSPKLPRDLAYGESKTDTWSSLFLVVQSMQAALNFLATFAFWQSNTDNNNEGVPPRFRDFSRSSLFLREIMAGDREPAPMIDW